MDSSAIRLVGGLAADPDVTADPDAIRARAPRPSASTTYG